MTARVLYNQKRQLLIPLCLWENRVKKGMLEGGEGREGGTLLSGFWLQTQRYYEHLRMIQLASEHIVTGTEVTQPNTCELLPDGGEDPASLLPLVDRSQKLEKTAQIPCIQAKGFLLSVAEIAV